MPASDTRAFQVTFSHNWPKVIEALKHEVRGIVKEEEMLLTVGAAKEARIVARDVLDEMVYNAPLPPSAQQYNPVTRVGTWGGPSHWQSRSRIGRTREAIKADVVPRVGVDEIYARIYVDHADYPAWNYAFALEYGMTSISNQFGDHWPAVYKPRPFFRTTARLMRAWYGHEGSKVAKSIAHRIEGRFA